MRSAICQLGLGLVLLAPPAGAFDPTPLPVSFEHWLQLDVWPEADARGIPRPLFEKTLRGIEPDRTLPNLGLPDAAKPNEQAEFDAPGRYFRAERFEPSIALATRQLRKRREELAAIESAYGVPGRIVVAIWGRESSFGQARPAYDAISVLATRAFLGKRRGFFREELFAALAMLASGEAPRGRFRSSSAGALGQPQFMPSKFLAYAVDFDGDGERDIWRSRPDSLASIANYLRAHGWDPQREWGFEVSLPASVPCTLEGPDRARSVAQWRTLGIERTRARSFPPAELEREASLLMPAGRLGPAFLVTENFYVLKRYNRADLYALYVGHLADRMIGGPGFAEPWHGADGLHVADVLRLQRDLEADGHDVGGVDGLIGFRTRTAIGLAQERAGIAPTCFPDPVSLSAR